MKAFIALLGLLVILNLFMPPAVSKAEANQTIPIPITLSFVHFRVIDRNGNIVPDAGRLDVWIRATGEDFQSSPTIGNGRGYYLRRGIEYQAFLGLAPWPDPGNSSFKIVDTEYLGVEATTQEVGPYTSFVTIGETGYVTYTVASINELFLPAVWLQK